MLVFMWVVLPCCTVGGCQGFGGTSSRPSSTYKQSELSLTRGTVTWSLLSHRVHLLRNLYLQALYYR